MKILLLSLLLFFACKKETPKPFCFHCTFSRSAAGWQKPPLDTCINSQRVDKKWSDPYGNDLSSFCVPQ